MVPTKAQPEQPSLRDVISRLAAATPAVDPDAAFQSLAHTLATAVGTTLCRVSTVDANGRLAVRADYSVRPIPRRSLAPGKITLSQLPKHREAVEQRAPVIVRQDLDGASMPETEMLATLGAPVKSAVVLPLVHGDRVVGVASLGEARAWERNPLDERKLSLARELALHAAILAEQAETLRAVQQSAAALQGRLSEIQSVSRHEATSNLADRVFTGLADPVTIILCYSDMLLQDLPLDDPHHLHAEQIHRGAVRIVELLHRLENDLYVQEHSK